MEEFRYIADETIPSFLANSLTSGTSEIWDNITIASSLGLPVAASTEARQNIGCHERLCDQASYMEEGLSIQSPLSNCDEAVCDPRKKLALTLKDTTDSCNKPEETLLESVQKEELLESVQREESMQRRENQKCNDECLDNSQATLCDGPLEQLEDLNSGICSFSGRKSQDSKVSVFPLSQKWVQGPAGDNDTIGFYSLIENEKLLTFASLEDYSSDDDDDIGDEFCDDQLEAYFEKLALPEMQVDDTEEDEHDKCMKAMMELLPEEVVKYPAHEQDQLQNDSSDKHPKMEISTATANDSQLICSDVAGALDCGNENGTDLKANTFSNGQNVREDTENQASYVSADESSYAKDIPNTISCAEPNLDSLYFKCNADNNAESKLWHREEQVQCSHLYQDANESSAPLEDEYLSPSACQRSDQYQGSAEEESSQNVVYQNEEGRWVTDLAYYTSFNKEQVSSLLNTSENFVAGSDAIDVIAKDQKEFEREHRFIQEEQIDPQNTSGLGDTSWKSFSSYKAVRASQAEDYSKDASYLRLSLGEFFGQRSEALGCLGGDSDVKRPSFGYYITSPEKRQPVALLRESVANSDEPSKLSRDTVQGNVEDSIKEKPHSASATFILAEKDTSASKCINMEIETKSKTQEKTGKRKAENIHTEVKPPGLSISTIASAIANASVTAEPSQLAAMIMALLNSKERTSILEAEKPADLSVLSQFLNSNIGNSTFDIEKYLRRTEEGENDTKLESFFNHEDISTGWQKSLYKQEHQIISTEDLSKSSLYSKHDKEKQHLERDYKGNCSKDSSCNTTSSKKENSAGSLDPCLQVESNTNNNFQTKQLTSIAPSSKERPGHEEKVLEEHVTNMTYVDERVTQDVQYQNKQDGRIMKKNSAYSNEKHVTFEKSDGQKLGEAFVETEQRLASPVPIKQISDEQCSFRPSTSPLTHSSPSEASGTVLSGYDDCPSTTPDLKQSSCSDSTLRQSDSRPSLGRLTFVSASENTINNLMLSSPERQQRNDGNELSTTIVWTSPPSALDQNSVNKNIALQTNKKLSSLTRKLEGTEPKNQSEDQKTSAECASKSKDQFARICSDVIPSNNEPCQADIPVTYCGYTNIAPGPSLSSINTLPPSKGFNGLNLNTPLNQNTPNLNSLNAASKVSAAPFVMPTLLTGCSLRATPFAQQYIGNLPSSTNIALPQYHLDCPQVFGLPAGLMYSSVSVGHARNSLAAEMALGPNVGSGLLGATAHYKFTSNPHINSESGCVKVPEEIKFCDACCVGLTSQTVLSILNPTERWLQVCISLRSITLNGEKMEPLKHGCLLFKNKTIIGPCTAEEIKILFLPCQAGVYQCVLSIASWPLSADAQTIVQAEALAARVILNAVAENPDLEVEVKRLDFGDLPSGSWKGLPLKLINKTHARVPVRLVINANAVAWRCFTFSKEPLTFPVKSPVHTCNISQLAAPSVISYVMNPSYNEQNPEAVVVWVRFHAPSKHISSDVLGPPDEYLARIDVEVDCPEPANILSIPLCAKSGTPRIYAPKSLQTLHMSARIGSSTKQQLPLKNAGNISVDLKIMTLEPSGSISFEPEELALTPGEEQQVTVQFSPKECGNAESVLKIFVLPSGPEYKVTVKAEGYVAESKPLTQMCHNSEVPPILSNKQFVTWGGVQLGRTAQQELILRNDSQTFTQQLRLLIRGQDQDCFHIKLGEHVYSECEIKIRPKYDYDVSLIFTPSRLACMLAKLEMKQSGFPTRQGIKFTIPLYGYGGKCSVILENVKKDCNKYLVELNGLSPGKISQVSFFLRNTGSRAAYVKALCFRNFCKRIIMDPHILRVFPEKFVFKEGEQQKVTIVCYSSEGEHNNASVLSTICFFYGDEISRLQYLRSIQHNPQQGQNILPANNPAINVKFDEQFPGEELVTEVCDLPQQTNDIQGFFKNMRRIILDVYKASASASLNALPPPSAHHIALDGPGVPEIDILPVKGPHGCILPANTKSQNVTKQKTWTVQPDLLSLSAPSQSGITDTKRTLITNNSNKSLKFELSWPAHCLTVTPQHGTIEPGSGISIHVSPNPSLADNKSIIPWSGLVYIHCDNEQKPVRVQIRENTFEQSQRNPTVSNLGLRHHHTELPVNIIKPIQKPPSTQIEIKNRTLVFPETKSCESSERFLEFENNGNENVKWCLTSFAPTYVKGTDESGEVYRATYTAFQCSCSSGTLEAHEKEKVAVTFLPRDRGDYSQFWDLDCHPVHEPHLKDKYRLHFSGVGSVENEALKNEASASALIKVNVPVTPPRRNYPDTSDPKAGEGVCTEESVYTFPPTSVGESSMLKIRLRNYSSSSTMLKFLKPREPFYIKHSHFNLRCHHYCNLPVFFRPVSASVFKSLLVVQTEKNNTLTIQLLGEGLPLQ